MQIFTVMPNSERTYFYKDTATKPNTLRGAMKLISKSFGHDIKKMDDNVNVTSSNSRANLNAIEKEVLLPFLIHSNPNIIFFRCKRYVFHFYE